MARNKINAASLASKLVTEKWLLNPAAHANLTTLVGKYLEDPQIPTYGEEQPFVLDNGANISESDVTAVINVNGILVKGCSQLEEVAFGLVNTDYIRDCIDDALSDDTVKDIVLVFNSPGGETTGIEELGRKIVASDSIKPILAWTETMCASAAYWLASQCRCIGMTPSGKVGSIGVYSLIADNTKALEQAGTTINAIFSGKYKLLGHDFHTLTPEEVKIMQDDVDASHAKFKETILSRRTIDAMYLEGLIYEGTAAMQYGFADVVVDTFSDFLTTSDKMNNNNMPKFDKVSKVSASSTIKKNAEITNVNVPKVPVDTSEAANEVTPAVPIDSGKVACPSCKCSFNVELPAPPEDIVPSQNDDSTVDGTNKADSETETETDKDDGNVASPDDKKQDYADDNDSGAGNMPDAPADPMPDKMVPKKKMSLADLDMNEWKKAFGLVAPTNAFHQATMDFLKEYNSKK